MSLRTWIAPSLWAGCLAGWLGLATTPTTVQAQPAEQETARAETQLPITRVVLFSSGVAYIQREGEVTGNAKIDLAFPASNINDLLKSMVLRDLDGGRIAVVSLDSSDPVEKTLKSFALDLTQNPTFGGILKQARGERVEVTLAPTSTQPGNYSGTIISVETQKQSVKDQVIDVELLNLLTQDGIRSLPLKDVQKLRFLNPNLDRELKQALETLAKSHDTRKKSVSVNFTGQGKRRVAVGYVVEHPIWKTSYRLVLDKEGKPFLQGWALVENPSDEDWKEVRMTLVSGRPISFVMDLYQPLYVNRPKVEPELFASLRPPTYSGALENRRDAGRDRARTQNMAPMRRAAPAGMGGGGGAPGAPGMPGVSGELLEKDAELRLDQGVQSAATATEIGDFFQYAIDQPVGLQRQKSAMLPIVNLPVEGTKVSIYNVNVHAKYPLLGLKFKNTTGLHLMQGPVTVFEGNSYAGDARILDLQPKEERLLSYAIDLGTEVEYVFTPNTDRMTKIKLYKGLLYTTHQSRMLRTYNVKNRSEHERTVIVEHPITPGWKLAADVKPTERSREAYRFQVKVAAGQGAKVEVAEEMTHEQTVQLTNFDDQSIRYYLSSPVLSAKAKEALEKAVEMRNKLADAQRKRSEVERQIQAIREDQTRMQNNLKVLPQGTAAYQRLIEKFDKQETELEQLSSQAKTLREAETKFQKDYETYLMGLNVE
jgi:hypothetical protein